jgi:hypothetical protein
LRSTFYAKIRLALRELPAGNMFGREKVTEKDEEDFD